MITSAICDPFEELIPSRDPFEELFPSTLDHPIVISLFDHVTKDTGCNPIITSLRKLAKLVSTPTKAVTKDQLPLLKCAEFGEDRNGGSLLRNNANVTAITGLEGDYDEGQITIDDAAERIRKAGLAALIYSTTRHTGAVPRWRALLPTSKALPPSERAALYQHLSAATGISFDTSSETLSQSYYYGSLAGAAPPQIKLVDGLPIDIALATFVHAPLVANDIDNDDANFCRAPDWPRIESALAVIPVVAADKPGENGKPGGRDLWLTVGMSLHSAARGGEEGFKRWTDWAIPGEKYKGERDQRIAWKFRRKGGTNIGIGTLFHIAKLFGWCDPVSVKADPIDGVGVTSPADRDPIVANLNRHHAVVAHSGRTLITTEHADGSVNFGTVSDLNVLYANQRHMIAGSKTDRSEPISAYWLRHSERRTFPRGVVFAPGKSPRGALNLWRGWAVKPDPAASCERFCHHILTVVCRGNLDHAGYVFGWLAHLVQRPAEKPGVAIVLRGGKGAGKDTVVEYLATMIGRHHVPTVSHENHIVGNFNRRLESALILHVQEGTWAGDRKAESVLKYLVTSEVVEIERKGIDSFSLESFLRLVVSSNSDWVVPASEDERRWAVFEVSDERRGDASYFAALRAEMGGSGPAALLHYLKNYNLGDFNVRIPPETEGLRNQKLASLRNIELWWYETLCRGEIVTGDWRESDGWRKEAVTVGRDTLRGYYLEWLKSLPYRENALNEVQFGQRMREMVVGLDTVQPRVAGRRVRQYVVPTLDECRIKFAARFGDASGMQWGDDT